MVKIFVADDSPIVCRCLTGLIGEIPGVEIAGQGSDSAAILDAVRTVKPHVVILEVHLRDGRGLELLRTIKNGSSAPVVIVFSSYSYPQLLDACINAGADFFFKKSHDFTALAGTVRSLIAQGSSLLLRSGLAAAAPSDAEPAGSPSSPLASPSLPPSKEIHK